jgi:hypothetical protein
MSDKARCRMIPAAEYSPSRRNVSTGCRHISISKCQSNRERMYTSHLPIHARAHVGLVYLPLQCINALAYGHACTRMRIHLHILLFITVNRMLIHARAHARMLHMYQRARADVRRECPCISHRSRLAVRQREGQIEAGTEEAKHGKWSILATVVQASKYLCQELGSRWRTVLK